MFDFNITPWNFRFFSQINEFFDKRIGISQEISTYFFYLFQLYNVIPLRTIREVIVEKVGSGEVCFNSSFLSYSVVIPPHKKNEKTLILTLTRLICDCLKNNKFNNKVFYISISLCCTVELIILLYYITEIFFLSVVLQETLKELLNFFVINCTVVRAIHKTNCLRNFRLLVWVLNSPTAYLFSNCGADFHWGMLFRRVPLWETVSIVLAGQL